MDETKRRERQILDQFCLKNQLVGDFDFCSYDWETFLKPKLQEFFNSIKFEESPDKFRYRCPIRYISNDTKDEMLWNEYWAVASRNDDTIDYIRKQICGVGSRKVKQALLYKTSVDCLIARYVFEVEDVVISSKRYFGYYLKKNIERRNKFLNELVILADNFPEKITISKVKSLVVCNTNIFGQREQFCWSIDEQEQLPFIKDGDPMFTNIKVATESKISRIEKLLERAMK